MKACLGPINATGLITTSSFHGEAIMNMTVMASGLHYRQLSLFSPLEHMLQIQHMGGTICPFVRVMSANCSPTRHKFMGARIDSAQETVLLIDFALCKRPLRLLLWPRRGRGSHPRDAERILVFINAAVLPINTRGTPFSWTHNTYWCCLFTINICFFFSSSSHTTVETSLDPTAPSPCDFPGWDHQSKSIYLSPHMCWYFLTSCPIRSSSVTPNCSFHWNPLPRSPSLQLPFFPVRSMTINQRSLWYTVSKQTPSHSRDHTNHPLAPPPVAIPFMPDLWIWPMLGWS